jgi:hypothetical protein
VPGVWGGLSALQSVLAQHGLCFFAKCFKLCAFLGWRSVRRVGLESSLVRGPGARAVAHVVVTHGQEEQIVGGIDIAELLGHTSTEMVMRHYSPIAGKIDHMREAAMKAASA